MDDLDVGGRHYGGTDSAGARDRDGNRSGVGRGVDELGLNRRRIDVRRRDAGNAAKSEVECGDVDARTVLPLRRCRAGAADRKGKVERGGARGSEGTQRRDRSDRANKLMWMRSDLPSRKY